MEAIETNEREIFCPHCTEMLRIDWHALPSPTPSQNGAGWWLSCGHCQHRWWVPCPSSPEYQESLKKLKELLTAFDEAAADSPKADIPETVTPQTIPSVQVVSDDKQPSALASLLGVGEGTKEDPFASFQSLSFADWLENQKESAKNKKTAEDSSSHPEDKTHSSASSSPANASNFLTKEDLQDLKNSLLQAFRDELAQVAKPPVLSSAKLRDPRNKEVLENRKGADFFPKKTTKKPSGSSDKEAEQSPAPISNLAISSAPIAASSTSEKKSPSFWLRFRQRLTLKPSSDKNLATWAEELPYLAPVLPMVGADNKAKNVPTEEHEGQIIPFRARRTDSPFPDFPRSGRSGWISFKKRLGKKSEEQLDQSKGKLVFPKEFQKEKASSPVATDPQSLQNDLDRLLHGAERAHQKRQKKSAPSFVSDASLNQQEPTLSRTSPTISREEPESSTGTETTQRPLSAKTKLGLTLAGTGLIAVGALALTVRYKDAALSLWKKTVPLCASIQGDLPEDSPSPETSKKVLKPEPVSSPEHESDQRPTSESRSKRELFPSLNGKPEIKSALETASPSKELLLEHVSYSLSKNTEASAEEALRCVVVTGEIMNPTDAAAPIPPISVTMTSTKWPGKLLYSGRYTHHLANLAPNGRSSFQIEKSLLMADDEDLKIELAFSESDENVDTERAESD